MKEICMDTGYFYAPYPMTKEEIEEELREWEERENKDGQVRRIEDENPQ